MLTLGNPCIFIYDKAIILLMLEVENASKMTHCAPPHPTELGFREITGHVALVHFKYSRPANNLYWHRAVVGPANFRTLVTI